MHSMKVVFFWGWMDQWVRLQWILPVSSLHHHLHHCSKKQQQQQQHHCSESQHLRVSLPLDLHHSWNTGRIVAAQENQRTYTSFLAMVPLFLFLVVRFSASIPHPTSAGEFTEHNSVCSTYTSQLHRTKFLTHIRTSRQRLVHIFTARTSAASLQRFIQMSSDIIHEGDDNEMSGYFGHLILSAPSNRRSIKYDINASTAAWHIKDGNE